jgi:hypothetical protein
LTDDKKREGKNKKEDGMSEIAYLKLCDAVLASAFVNENFKIPKNEKIKFPT